MFLRELAVRWWLLQLSGLDREVRLYACGHLGRLGGLIAVDALMSALADVDSEVREAACVALGASRDPRALEPLLLRMSDGVLNVRLAAAEAVRRLGYGPIVALLLETSGRGMPEEVAAMSDETREQALQILTGWISSPFERLCWMACLGLGRLGDRRAVPALLRLVRPEQDRTLLQAALAALGALKDPAALGPVAALLEVEDATVQELACVALGKLGGASSPYLLIEQLHAKSPAVRRAACSALGHLGDVRVAGALAGCLTDPAETVREAACSALGEVKAQEAVEALIGVLRDLSPHMRDAAVLALGRIGDARAAAPITACLGYMSTASLHTACTALHALGEGTLSAGVQELMAATEPLGPSVRTLAECYPDLPRLLGHWLDAVEPSLRRAGCLGLGALGDGTATPGLEARLKDDVWQVREAACIALGQLCDERALPGLLERMRDDHAEVRLAACRAVAGYADLRAGEALIRQLDDISPQVREAVFEGLARHDGEAVVNMLDGSLRGYLPDMQALAATVAHGNLPLYAALVRLCQAMPVGRHTGSSVEAVIGKVQDTLITHTGEYLAPYQSLSERASLEMALSITRDRLNADITRLLCPHCLARAGEQVVALTGYGTLRVVGCRLCGEIEALQPRVEPLVAVLDETMFTELRELGRELWVNALLRTTPFDYDAVLVRRVSDQAVERFCLTAGNDTDCWRARRYPRIPVTIGWPGLSDNARRVLDHIFGTVHEAEG